MTITEEHSPNSKRGELGQGLYGLDELRLYVAYYGSREDGQHVPYWLGSVLNPVAHQKRSPDYSFSDLISLFVVRELLRLGVRPRRIREAEQYMRNRFVTDRPFVTEEVATDRDIVFVRSDVPEQLETAATAGGQQVDRLIVGPYLRRVRYSDGTAVAWNPADDVVLDPEIQFGDPVIDGTRVLTAQAADAAEHLGIDRAGLGSKYPCLR